MNNQKINFFIGIGGTLVGLLVGFTVFFMNHLPSSMMFYLMSFIFLVIILLLAGTSLFLFRILPGAIKAVSVFPLFGLFQIWNGIPFFVGTFDDSGLIEKFSYLFDVDIFLIMPIVFAIGFGGMIFGMFKPMYLNAFVRDKVIKEGYKIDAKIISVEETNMRVNGRRQYKVNLSFTAPKFGKCEKELLMYISPLNVSSFKVGNSIKVAVSKTNKNHVFIV